MNPTQTSDFRNLYISAALFIAPVVLLWSRLLNPEFVIPEGILVTIYFSALVAYLYFLWKVTKALNKSSVLWLILTVLTMPIGVLISCVLIAMSKSEPR
jgi:hypothetical protein